jgi:predicted small lipoprotein YifL
MLISKQILVTALTLSPIVASLTGCGQTGSLYLPVPQTPVNAASGAAVTLPATGIFTRTQVSTNGDSLRVLYI